MKWKRNLIDWISLELNELNEMNGWLPLHSLISSMVAGVAFGGYGFDASQLISFNHIQFPSFIFKERQFKAALFAGATRDERATELKWRKGTLPEWNVKAAEGPPAHNPANKESKCSPNNSIPFNRRKKTINFISFH